MDQQTLTRKPLILVAPLDWGLGHATRCIPVIRQLLAFNCCVLLAGEDKVESLLKNEFPHLLFIPLQGYRIKYGKTKYGLIARLFWQLPRLLNTIRQEHQWLKAITIKHKIDAVISDNRYGLYNKSIYSIFITHQLLIKTPFGKRSDKVAQQLNYRYINRFNECWVPDDSTHLAGELSHPQIHPKVPLYYMGALTRFSFQPAPQSKHVLILLSGPEPQRTVLEKIIVQQLQSYNKPVLIIRGLPGNKEIPTTTNYIKIVNHLPAHLLENEIRAASFVISRCGYSTVMDLMVMKKKSILIPTPGQTEQEYLAQHLMKQNRALCIPQSMFKLRPALELAESFKYQLEDFGNNKELQTLITRLVQRLSASTINH